jgi:hypothetical protein
MKTALKLTALIAAAAAALTLSGCYIPYYYQKEPSRIFKANRDEYIDKTINLANETYGTEFKFERKLSPKGGALCHIAVTCDELGDKEVDLRLFDEVLGAYTDYSYLMYGSEALERIMKAAKDAAPDCAVEVYDISDNHCIYAPAGGIHSLDDYLMNNEFSIMIYLPDKLEKDELVAEYKRLARAMLGAGINCQEFHVGCPVPAECIKPLDHIIADIGEEEDNRIPFYCERSIFYRGVRSLYRHINEPKKNDEYELYIDGDYWRESLLDETENGNENGT